MKFGQKFNIKDLFKKDKKEADTQQETEAPNEKGKRFFSNIGDKVGDAFNYEPQKERVLSQEDFKGAGDVYYASVSAMYKVAQRLLLLILVVFMVFSLITNYKEITYNNFFYLLRDFSAAAESQSSDYQTLSYDSNERQKFALYRGGLVSVAPSSVSLFTASGRRTLKNNNDYYSPNVVCCGKYVLVYDSASSSFSVYNSFSKIYNEKFEEGNVITNACFDDDGALAISSRVNDSKTVIYLYNKDLKLRGKISDGRYILDMSLDASSKKLAAVYYDEGNGIGRTTLCVYDIENNTSAAKLEEIELEGEFPLACTFLDDSKIGMITNRSINIYNKKFEKLELVEFKEAAITAFDVKEEGVVAVISDGTGKKVIAFDKNGDLLYNSTVSDNISNVNIYEKYVFLQTVSGVKRIDCQGNEAEFLPCDGGEMLVYNEDTAIVCGEARAEYLVFGKKR